jgi:hypothetical protein
VAKSDRGYAGTLSQPRTLRTIAVDKGADPAGLEPGDEWDANAGMPKAMAKGKYTDERALKAKTTSPRPSARTAGFKFK